MDDDSQHFYIFLSRASESLIIIHQAGQDIFLALSQLTT